MLASRASPAATSAFFPCDPLVMSTTGISCSRPKPSSTRPVTATASANRGTWSARRSREGHVLQDPRPFRRRAREEITVHHVLEHRGELRLELREIDALARAEHEPLDLAIRTSPVARVVRVEVDPPPTPRPPAARPRGTRTSSPRHPACGSAWRASVWRRSRAEANPARGNATGCWGIESSPARGPVASPRSARQRLPFEALSRSWSVGREDAHVGAQLQVPKT